MINRDEFTSRIERFARARLGLMNGTLRYSLALRGLLVAVAGLVVLSGWLPGALLNALLYLVLAGVALALVVKYLRGREGFRGHMYEAFCMEEMAGGMNSRLISALDFLGSPEPAPLMRAVIQRAERDLEFDFESRLDRSRFTALRRRCAALLVVLGGLGIFLAGPFIQNLRHSLFAVSEMLYPVSYRLHPEPGHHVYMLGEETDVSIEFLSRAYRQVELVTVQGEERHVEPLDVNEDFVAGVTVGSDSEATYSMHFRFGDRTSEGIQLTFSDYPVVENMQTELVYPAYTRMLPRSLEGVQSRLHALRNTKITLGFTFSKQLQRAKLVWEDGEELPLDVTGRYASTTFVHTRNRRAALEVEDVHGFTLQHSPEIAFVAREDEQPQVFLPGTLDEEMPVLAEGLKLFGFGARARDDFGVTRCILHWTKSTIDDPTNLKERGEVERLISPVRREALVEFMNVFEHLSVEPGDRVTFWLEALDNKHPENQSVESPRRSLFVHQEGLDDLDVDSLGFGSGEISRGRLPRSKRQADLKAPEGLRTVQDGWNEYKGEVDTSTMAPRVPADSAQAIKDYFRLMSTAVREEDGQDQ